VKPPHVANDNLIDRTREVWEPRFGRNLSCEDVRQIAEDVTGFFAILAEWSRAQLPIPVNDDSKSSNSDGGEMRHES
jgi:hypothetical protein